MGGCVRVTTPAFSVNLALLAICRRSFDKFPIYFSCLYIQRRKSNSDARVGIRTHVGIRDKKQRPMQISREGEKGRVTRGDDGDERRTKRTEGEEEAQNAK